MSCSATVQWCNSAVVPTVQWCQQCSGANSAVVPTVEWCNSGRVQHEYSILTSGQRNSELKNASPLSLSNKGTNFYKPARKPDSRKVD